MSLLLISQAYSFSDDEDEVVNSERRESSENSLNVGKSKRKNKTKYFYSKVKKAKSERTQEIPDLFEQWPFKQFKFVFNFEKETTSEQLKEGWKQENKTFVYYENVSKEVQDELKEKRKSQLALANKLEKDKIDKKAKVADENVIFTSSVVDLFDQMENKSLQKLEIGQPEKIAPKPSEEKMLYLNQCIMCLKRFPSFSKLERHILTHTKERPFNCLVCDKSFALVSNLKSHNFIHAEDVYQCKVCGNSFKNLNYVRRHEKVHSGQKLFHCLICNKRFTRSDGLAEHKKVHTGDKPYQCSVCGKRFRKHSNFKLHERLHTGEKPYKCTICNQRFALSTYLKRHGRIHTKEI